MADVIAKYRAASLAEGYSSSAPILPQQLAELVSADAICDAIAALRKSIDAASETMTCTILAVIGEDEEEEEEVDDEMD